MATYLKQDVTVKGSDNSDVREVVAGIIDRIDREGDSAVRYYSRKFDDWDPPSLRVTGDEVNYVLASIPERVKSDIDFCQSQVARFAEAQKAQITDFEIEMAGGSKLGQKTIPVASSGSYIPGGRYPLVASAHMSLIPPRVAGVKRIVACTPPLRGGGLYPATLYAIVAAGANEIYCLGGVQALAAMALGTETIRPVDLLIGAGNRYVAEAKRQLSGRVGIDLVAGPTEILIIADESADARIVAADLVGQGEHDPDSRPILVTLSEDFGRQVIKEVGDQLAALPTRTVAEASWQAHGEVVVVRDREEAVSVADAYAPEHLEVQTTNPDWYLGKLTNYGSLFLGELSTVAYGDKVIGTNHILPTRGAARFTGGLWVGKFLKTLTYQWTTKEATEIIGPVCSRACALEGMAAHQLSVDRRMDKYGITHEKQGGD